MPFGLLMGPLWSGLKPECALCTLMTGQPLGTLGRQGFSVSEQYESHYAPKFLVRTLQCMCITCVCVCGGGGGEGGGGGRGNQTPTQSLVPRLEEEQRVCTCTCGMWECGKREEVKCGGCGGGCSHGNQELPHHLKSYLTTSCTVCKSCCLSTLRKVNIKIMTTCSYIVHTLRA